MIVQNENLKKEFKLLDMDKEIDNRSTIVRKSNVKISAYLHQRFCFSETYILITCCSDAGNCNERKLSIILKSLNNYPWSYIELGFVIALFKQLFSNDDFKDDFYGEFSKQQFPRLISILKVLDKDYFEKDLEYCVYLSEGYKVEDTFINLEEYIYDER